MSLSARRAWIEIILSPVSEPYEAVALRKESVDRNNRRFTAIDNAKMSLSARRAWIEIIISVTANVDGFVALRKESVDRNGQSTQNILTRTAVALRKESVDRNNRPDRQKHINRVALRKESVDRNGGLMSVVRFATCRSPQGERG